MTLGCVWLEDGRRCGQPTVDGRNCARHRREREAGKQAAAQLGALRWATRPTPSTPKPNPWRQGGWARIAAAYLADHQRCEYAGCTEHATLVHHRDGSGRRGNRADNRDENLEALCVKHHGQRHAQLHRDGRVILGPKSAGGARVPTTPRQTSARQPRKKPAAQIRGVVSQNSRNRASC